jgi:hypothetical protein
MSFENDKEAQAQAYRTVADRRRAALSELDSASFNRWHVKAVMTAGVGFFTESVEEATPRGKTDNEVPTTFFPSPSPPP